MKKRKEDGRKTGWEEDRQEGAGGWEGTHTKLVVLVTCVCVCVCVCVLVAQFSSDQFSSSVVSDSL